MHYPYLPLAAFIAALLVVIPLPWHWWARNIPTMSIMGWLFVINIVYFVNTIVWAGNVNNPSPVWCDISAKLVIGAQHALPAATFCICRSLEFIASNRVVMLDRASKRRWMIFDLSICFGVPAILIILHYVVQGHRFDIIEDFGCQPATYFSVPGILIVFFPPLFFSFLTLIFASAALHHFMKRRIAFSTHLANSNSSLTTNRYLRLMGMSIVMMVWGTTLTSYDLAINTAPGLRPWISWANVHSNFSRVDLYPTLILPPGFLQQIMLFWWAMPVSAYIVFLFFGLGEEARKEYRKVWNAFHTKVLRRPAKPDAASSLPLFHSHPVRFPTKTFSSLNTSTTTTITTTFEPKGTPLALPLSSKHTLPPYPSLRDKALLGTPVPSTPSTCGHISSTPSAALGHAQPASPRPFSYPTVLIGPVPEERKGRRSRSSSPRRSSAYVAFGETV